MEVRKANVMHTGNVPFAPIMQLIVIREALSSQAPLLQMAGWNIRCFVAFEHFAKAKQIQCVNRSQRKM